MGELAKISVRCKTEIVCYILAFALIDIVEDLNVDDALLKMVEAHAFKYFYIFLESV